MTDNNAHNHTDDLDLLIDSLTVDGIDLKDTADLEIAQHLGTIEKIVRFNESYPGAPKISTSQRLELLTALRTEIKQKERLQKKPQDKFFQRKGIRWAAAAAGIIVVAWLGVWVLQGTSGASLPATAGSAGMGAALVVLALAVVGIIVNYFIRKR